MLNSIAIVATGLELLDGRVLESNAHWMAEQLTPHGINIRTVLVCGDERQDIIESLRHAQAQANFVIVSGGLGPTSDDQTREAIAECTGNPLRLDQGEISKLKEYYAARARKFDPANEKQALFPSGAEVIQNPNGTAPGFFVTSGTTTFASLPGVPRELRTMFAQAVLPAILNKFPNARPVATKLFRLFGLPESTIGRKIDALHIPASVVVSYRAKFPEVFLLLKSYNHELLEALAPEVEAALESDFIFSKDPSLNLEATVFKALCQANKTIAVAESCTGGLLGASLSSCPGSSRAFLGGVLSYSNALKESLLEVPHQLLETYGAVSAEVAAAMARGVRRRCESDIGVSITGIAGPDGGTAAKPVGTFYVGLADGASVAAFQYFFPSTRESVRTFAAAAALDLLRRTLGNLPRRTIIGNGQQVSVRE